MKGKSTAFIKGKMNGNDSSSTPLISVSSGASYHAEMMDALEQDDPVALRAAVSHLSPAELNRCFTHGTDGVFSLTTFDLPSDVQRDLSDYDEINISPIHYAAMMGYKACLETLLAGKADPNIKDGLGQTALHILPKSKWRHNIVDFQGCLDVLLAHKDIDTNRLDLSKSTPFSRAEQYEWSYMMNKLRELGSDGSTSALGCSSTGKERSTLIADALLKDLLEFNFERFKTTLGVLKSLNFDNKVILDESHGSYTLLQYACRCGKFDFVDELLIHGASATIKDDINILSAVMWSTKFGYHRILQRLVKSMTDVDLQQGAMREHNMMGETPLHMSVKCTHYQECDDVNYYDCLQILLEKKEHLDLDAKNDDGNTALHFAALCDDVRAFTCLLKKGAICSTTNVFGVCALQYVGKEGMMKILNDCIEFDTKRKVIDQDFWIKVNFEMMQTDYSKDQSIAREMIFLNLVAEIFKDKDILHHPLVDIFKYLKWQRIKKIFLLNFAFHVIFLMLLMTYIGMFHSSSQAPVSGNAGDGVLTTSDDSHQNNQILRNILIAFLLLTLFFKGIAQLFMMKSWKEYFSKMKNITEVITAVLTVLLLCTPLNAKVKMGIAAWLVLVSLLEFVLHLGRLPPFAVYITMLNAVAWNFFKFICMFSILLIAFSFSFYLMFQVDDNFKTFPESLLKTIVMTTGEVEYSDLPVSAFPVASHALMVVFVFLILLVLMNLLNGLAISDIQDIQRRAEVISCMSFIDRMTQLEKAFYCTNTRNPFKKILDYLLGVTLMMKNCLPQNELKVYISQNNIKYQTDKDSFRESTICKCHSYKLEGKHIKALKQVVMEKKGAKCTM